MQNNTLGMYDILQSDFFSVISKIPTWASNHVPTFMRYMHMIMTLLHKTDFIAYKRFDRQIVVRCYHWRADIWFTNNVVKPMFCTSSCECHIGTPKEHPQKTNFE